MKWRKSMKGIDYLEEVSMLLGEKRAAFIKTDDDELRKVLSNIWTAHVIHDEHCINVSADIMNYHEELKKRGCECRIVQSYGNWITQITW